MLTIVFENVLTTFEAEILKIFKNIQAQPKIRRSYIEESVFEYLPDSVGRLWVEIRNFDTVTQFF